MDYISIWIHILAAFIWIGGMLFVGLMLVPVALRMEPPGTGTQFIRLVATRFRLIAWLCILALVVTGLINAWQLGITWEDVRTGALLDSISGKALVAKSGLVVLIIAFSFFHDFILGPKLSKLQLAARSRPRGEAMTNTNALNDASLRRLRLMVSWLARLNILLALSVVALASVVVRG